MIIGTQNVSIVAGDVLVIEKDTQIGYFNRHGINMHFSQQLERYRLNSRGENEASEFAHLIANILNLQIKEFHSEHLWRFEFKD